MKKSDVQISYHGGNSGLPMINVKHHLWLPDMFGKFEGNNTHEFSDDVGFWAWLHEIADSDDWDALTYADEWAAEHCWELAQEYADETWPGRKVKIWSAGRQGGWCVVDGLPPIEEWDAIALGRWAKFERQIRLLADDEYPYQWVWHLRVNVYEPNVVEPQLAAERAALEADRWIDALAGLVGAG